MPPASRLRRRTLWGDDAGAPGNAADKVAAGQALEIISEDDFLQRTALNSEKLRAPARGGSELPDFVPPVGVWTGGDTSAWFQMALRHPDGRATGSEPRAWCEQPIPADARWISVTDASAESSATTGLKPRTMRVRAQRGRRPQLVKSTTASDAHQSADGSSSAR